MAPSWREELKQLAEVESRNGTAITFYFQPHPPQNRAHRKEMILVKDLVRDMRRDLERRGKLNGAAPALDRIQRMADEMPRNGPRARAVFACPELDLWREFDLPVDLGGTTLYVNERFHLTPLAAAIAGAPDCIVVLVDRERARLLRLTVNGMEEMEQLAHNTPRQVRTDGFGGYEAGHIERSISNELMRHYKNVGERLLDFYNRGELHALLIGARPGSASDLERHLHPYVKQRTVGHLDADPTHADLNEVHERTLALLEQHRRGEEQALLREALGEAQRNGRGSLGLRHVLTSLERGEVQTILLGKDFRAVAVECRNCGHIDTRMVKTCAVCSQPTKELDDVTDALISHAFIRGVQIQYVSDDVDFERAGNIAAILRFRADQNTPEKLAG